MSRASSHSAHAARREGRGHHDQHPKRYHRQHQHQYSVPPNTTTNLRPQHHRWRRRKQCLRNHLRPPFCRILGGIRCFLSKCMPLVYTEIELAREVFALGVYAGFIRMITPNPPVWPPPEPVSDSQGQRPTFQGPTTLIGSIVFRTSAQREAALVRLEGHLRSRGNRLVVVRKGMVCTYGQNNPPGINLGQWHIPEPAPAAEAPAPAAEAPAPAAAPAPPPPPPPPPPRAAAAATAAAATAAAVEVPDGVVPGKPHATA